MPRTPSGCQRFVTCSLWLLCGLGSISCGGGSSPATKRPGDSGAGSAGQGGTPSEVPAASDSAIEAGCIPGEQQSCACAGTATGFQVCAADSKSFGPCADCSKTEPVVGGTSGGVGGNAGDAGKGTGGIAGGSDGASANDAGSGNDTGRGDAGPAATCITAWPMPNSPRLVPDGGPALPDPPNPQSYDTTTTGVVLDNVTGLMWQHPANPKGVDRTTAKAYCASLKLAGFSNWRMPTRIELSSIVDGSRIHPTINLSAFPNEGYGDHYLTSTPWEGNADRMWQIAFNLGSSFNETTGNRIRCVRATRNPADGPSACYAIENKTVRDLNTNLTWQQESSGATYTWLAAIDYCTTLSLDGGGWRLPTRQELQTIVDDKHWNPSIDETTFPHTPKELFWSASAFPVYEISGAAVVDFGSGSSFGYEKTDVKHYVRCVR